MQQLPEDIARLSRRNAVEVSDLRFHQDVDHLVDLLTKIQGVASRPTQSATSLAPPPVPSHPTRTSDKQDPVSVRGEATNQENRESVAAANQANTGWEKTAAIGDLPGEVLEALKVGKREFWLWEGLILTATVAALIVSFIIAHVIDSNLIGMHSLGRYFGGGDEAAVMAIFLATSAVFIGGIQATILGRELNSWLWIAASILGWGVTGSYFSGLGFRYAPFVLHALIGASASSLLQYLIVRRKFDGAIWWMVANIIPWAVAAAFLIIIASWGESYVRTYEILMIPGILIGFVGWLLATGLVAVWLRWRKSQTHVTWM